MTCIFKASHKKIFSTNFRKITTQRLFHPFSYLYYYHWLHAPFVESIEINPEDYRCEATEDLLVPTIFIGIQYHMIFQYRAIVRNMQKEKLCEGQLLSFFVCAVSLKTNLRLLTQYNY